MPWTCSICGEVHATIPTCFGADAPWRELGVTDDDFDERVELTKDLCVVDEEHFFMRGWIELPLVGVDLDEKVFAWSVWCSLSFDSFVRFNQRWNDADRVNDPPAFGWLMTYVPGYPDTIHLKTMVHQREPGRVAYIELEPTDHPLAVEQREGLGAERLDELLHLLLEVPS